MSGNDALRRAAGFFLSEVGELPGMEDAPAWRVAAELKKVAVAVDPPSGEGNHDGETCAEIDDRADDLLDEYNAIAMLLGRRGFEVDFKADRSLMHWVRRALPPRPPVVSTEREETQ